MPDLPSAAPPALTRIFTVPAQRSMVAPLWRGIRSVGLSCIAATSEQCASLVELAQRGAPMPVDGQEAADRARIHIIADLTPAEGRPALRLTARPSIVMDDAQGEWIGPTVIARDGEDFAALAARALDGALPWRGARPDTGLIGEMK